MKKDDRKPPSSHPRGGRRWQLLSEEAAAEFAIILSVKRTVETSGLSEDDKHTLFNLAIKQIPKRLEVEVTTCLHLLEARRRLVQLQFRERPLRADRDPLRTKELLEQRRKDRERFDRILRCDGMWQLARHLVERTELDIFAGSPIDIIPRWLRTARLLYVGALGDPHLFAAWIDASEQWTESVSNFMRTQGCSIAAESLDAERAGLVGGASPLGMMFKTEFLARTKGEPQSAARAWIIRQLNTMVPAAIAGNASRWAIIADILTHADIPTKAPLVRSTLTRTFA